MNKKTQRLTIAGLCLALCLTLPFLTGQIPTIGKLLSPMHIPVFLCGFLCGPFWGMLVGLVAPLLRSVLFQMPTLYPNAVCMMFELAVYGFVAGFLYRKMPRHKLLSLYIALISAMIAGRLVWGAVKAFLLGLGGSAFTLKMFMAGALFDAIPGIILHLALIPLLVYGLEMAGFSPEVKGGRK